MSSSVKQEQYIVAHLQVGCKDSLQDAEDCLAAGKC